MKYKVCFVSAARSEFGHLSKLISEFSLVSDTYLLLTGTHIIPDSPSLGEVKDYCESLNLSLILDPATHSASSSSFDLISNLTKSTDSIAGIFSTLCPDLVVLMGDRWELFSVSIPATMLRIPLAHISGGEITAGAIDDSIRHAHTKLSHLHFASSSEHAFNISSMGEEDWRIALTGEPGLDILHTEYILSIEELQKRIPFQISPDLPLLLFTFHPISYGSDGLLHEHIAILSKALSELNGVQIVITGPGREDGADQLRDAFVTLQSIHANIIYVESLGRQNYLSCMKYAALVLGNSSSGLIEAPSLGIRSVNIGNRQLGRSASKSVVNVSMDYQEITNACRRALYEYCQQATISCHNPYDPFADGQNSKRIVHASINALSNLDPTILLTKKLDFTVNSQVWSSDF